MSSISGVEGYINHFFINVLSQPELKEQMNLRYLSNCWDKYPYWYLWFAKESGAYKLELVDVPETAGYDWAALFKVKYYPREQEAVFKKLSIFEKTCRTSEIFHNHPCNSGGCPLHSRDHGHEGKFADLGRESGVPRTDCQGLIPEDFFFTGSILIAFDKTRGTLFRSMSQSAWRVVVTKDYELADEARENVIRLHKGAIDRDYPGSDLTNKLLSRILVGWNLFHCYRYQKDCVRHEPGVVFLFDGSRVDRRKSAEIVELTCETQLTYRENVFLCI